VEVAVKWIKFVVSLESQQPVENHLQHRGDSETDRPGVVQRFLSVSRGMAQKVEEIVCAHLPDIEDHANM